MCFVARLNRNIPIFIILFAYKPKGCFITQNEKSITILEEGDCIGEMALLDQEPRSAGALAIVDSILLKIDQEGFYELMSTNPEIMKQIVMILTQRVREMNKKVTSSL